MRLQLLLFLHVLLDIVLVHVALDSWAKRMCASILKRNVMTLLQLSLSIYF